MTGPFLSVAAKLVPGIGRVRAQTAPFAQAWRESNAAALLESGPLWVALGDSMTQGIGAADISGGWVGQLHRRLAASGRPLRVVNLSRTGARIRDVVAEQLPALAELPEPALVTVLAGANDMLTRARRTSAVTDYALLLGGLPATGVAVATLPRRNEAALAINDMIESAAAAHRLRIAEMRGRSLRSLAGTLADDHFHPNERGYAGIAAAFAAAVDGLSW